MNLLTAFEFIPARRYWRGVALTIAGRIDAVLARQRLTLRAPEPTLNG